MASVFCTHSTQNRYYPMISLFFLSRRLPNVVFNRNNYNFDLQSSKKNLNDPLGWGSEDLKESTIINLFI